MPKANRRAPTVIRLNLNPAIAKHRKVIEALDCIDGLQSIASVRARRVKQGQAAIEMLYRALSDDTREPAGIAAVEQPTAVNSPASHAEAPPARTDSSEQDVLGSLEDIMGDLQNIDPVKAMMG